jgi:hypothetical protein
MKTILFLIFLVVNIYADSWERAIQFVLEHEKSTYRHDCGWESKYGICSRWYPKENIKDMTKERATEIYYNDYWLRMSCQIQPDSNFALLIFDTAVNFGQPTAEIMLKQCFYDKDSFMRLRVRMMHIIIKKNPEKAVYYTTWTQRMLDLQKEMYPP